MGILQDIEIHRLVDCALALGWDDDELEKLELLIQLWEAGDAERPED